MKTVGEKQEEVKEEEEVQVAVWNPVDDPDRRGRWCLGSYPRLDTMGLNYRIFVYQDAAKELYFAASAVVFLVGYVDAEVGDVVPEHDLHTSRLGNFDGVFMKKKAVFNLLENTSGKDEVSFREWFEGYLAKCENNTVISVHNGCPA